MIIFPRRFELGEHRNDHQLATAKKFAELSNIYVAYTEAELILLLNDRANLSGANSAVTKNASNELIETVDLFLRGGSQGYPI